MPMIWSDIPKKTVAAFWSSDWSVMGFKRQSRIQPCRAAGVRSRNRGGPAVRRPPSVTADNTVTRPRCTGAEFFVEHAPGARYT